MALKRPDYESKRAAAVETLTDRLLNGSYGGWKQGAEYGALRQDYERQGRRAMEDTLGRAAAKTGGLPSSYAVTAAQQSYNGYLDRLEETARKAYEQDRAGTRSDLELLRKLEQDDYGRYGDALKQYNTDRAYERSVLESDRSDAYRRERAAAADGKAERQEAYQKERDAVKDARYEDETAYQRERDAVKDARYEDETAYKREQDAMKAGGVRSGGGNAKAAGGAGNGGSAAGGAGNGESAAGGGSRSGENAKSDGSRSGGENAKGDSSQTGSGSPAAESTGGEVSSYSDLSAEAKTLLGELRADFRSSRGDPRKRREDVYAALSEAQKSGRVSRGEASFLYLYLLAAEEEDD